MSSPTLSTCSAAAAHTDGRPDIDRLLAGRTLPVDVDAALNAGAVWNQLAASGVGIGLSDTLQAGIALSFGVPLATRDRKHFERVPGLELASLRE
jgi:tRNA(fMet)-specific endonuclease VapC